MKNKLILLGFILTMAAGNMKAQTMDTNKAVPVKVKNWGSLAVYITETFFAETKEDIIKQIGEDEFNWMKTHCSESGWPTNFSPIGLEEEAQAKFEKHRNELKLLRVASYQHKYNGNVFDRYVVLRVPYEQNRSWDDKLSWERSFYFIIKEEDVEEIKQ